MFMYFDFTGMLDLYTPCPRIGCHRQGSELKCVEILESCVNEQQQKQQQ